MKLIYAFLLLLFISCNDNNTTEEYQKKIIEEHLKGNLKYEFYDDSLIKEVSEIHNDRKRGSTIQFSTKGSLKRKFFINLEGKRVGDETLFNDAGIVSEHFFSLDSTRLLFYAKFNIDGKFEYSDGRPFYLHGRSEASVGDTIAFYIATPIIPGFQTKVSFYEDGNPESRVDYINDIRQFTYRKVISKKENLKMHLRVHVIDSAKNVILQDATKIIVKVNPNL